MWMELDHTLVCYYKHFDKRLVYSVHASRFDVSCGSCKIFSIFPIGFGDGLTSAVSLVELRLVFVQYTSSPSGGLVGYVIVVVVDNDWMIFCNKINFIVTIFLSLLEKNMHKITLCELMNSQDIWPIFGPYKHHVAVDAIRITFSKVLSVILKFRYKFQEGNTEPSGNLDCSRKR